MDNFVEQLVQKQKGGRDWAISAAAVIVTVVASVLCFLYLMSAFLIVMVGLIYASYWIISSLGREYEYCVTNGDIDIDLIVAKRSRKRIVSVRGSKIESLEPFSGTVPGGFDRTVMAVSSPAAKGCWRFTYRSKKNGHTQVIFEPNDAVLNELVSGLSRPMQVAVNQQRMG